MNTSITVTSEFLGKIVPRNGWYCAAVFPNGMKQPPRHIFRPTIKALAVEILAADAQGHNVFHACATYRAPGSRKQNNTDVMRAHWLDADVKPGQYSSQQEADAAITALCGVLGIPLPMSVNSGMGRHYYWPLVAEVSAQQWKANAVLLARCMDHFGVKHDPSRTTDEASILRPVGTHHRKGEPIPVTLVRDCEPIENDLFDGALKAYAAKHRLAAPRNPGAPMTTALLASTAQQFRPYSFHVVASKCAAMRDAAAVGGGPEPMWRAMLGLIKYSREGEALAHQISARDPRYDEAQTQRKIDGWLTGPPTCEHTRAVAQNPTACGACKHGRGKP